MLVGQPNLLCEFQVTGRPVSKDKVCSTCRMTPEAVLWSPHACTCVCTRVRAHICAHTQTIVNTNHGVNTKEGLPCIRLRRWFPSSLFTAEEAVRRGDVVCPWHISGTPEPSSYPYYQSLRDCVGPDQHTWHMACLARRGARSAGKVTKADPVMSPLASQFSLGSGLLPTAKGAGVHRHPQGSSL